MDTTFIYWLSGTVIAIIGIFITLLTVKKVVKSKHSNRISIKAKRSSLTVKDIVGGNKVIHGKDSKEN